MDGGKASSSHFSFSLQSSPGAEHSCGCATKHSLSGRSSQPGPLMRWRLAKSELVSVAVWAAKGINKPPTTEAFYFCVKTQ